MVFYGDRQRRYVQKRLLEGWQHQKPVIHVLMEPNTQVSERIIDISKILLYLFDVERI